MSGKNLQNGLIEHCAPTLAGLKSANLFRYFFDSEEDTEREIEEVNRLLNGRGVERKGFFYLLRKNNQ